MWTACLVGLIVCCLIAKGDDSCSRPAELVFLVDTSRSIYPLDFPHELNFVQSMIGQFQVGPNATRVAVVTFSNGFREEFGLNSYDSLDAMQIAVAKIPFSKGDTTDTGDAISYARQLLLRQARPDVTRIIICITDGRSTEKSQTFQEAAKVRDSGILMFAIGVGDGVDRRELGQIATQDSAQFVHTVDNFPGLSHISALLAHRACQVMSLTTTTATPPTTPTATVTTETTTVTKSTSAGTTPIPGPDQTPENIQNDPEKAKNECGGKPADIVFVVDRSNSVYINDFHRLIKVLQDIVSIMEIGRDETQIAAVSFSTNVTVEFYLDEYHTKANVLGRLGKIPYTGGVTETGLALSMVHDAVLSPQRGQRSAVAQVVMVLTDGLSQNMAFTKSAAALLKNDGVKVFAIGVGPNADRQELENIASQPYSNFLFQVDGYQALASIQYLLAVKACNARH